MKTDKEAAGRGSSEGHRQDTVSIVVNNAPCTIHRGRQTVAEIKDAGGVSPADELSQIMEGKYVPLAHGDSVVIKGGEEFQSNPPAGGSS